MSAVALTDRWGRLCSEWALVAVFRGSLLYRLTVGRAEFLALCLITLLMPFIPVTASAVLILAAGLLFLARAGKIPAWRDLLRLPLLAPMLLFLAVMLLLSVVSVTRGESLQITVLFGIYLVFYLMCLAELKDKRKIYVLTVIFLISVALEACFGLYQNFITKPPVDPSWIDSVAFSNITVRVFGTLDNPNILAQYLVPGIVLGLALALSKGRRLSTRVLFLGLAGVAGASLVYTWTRTGWLSLGVAIVVFLLFYDWRLLLLAATGVVVAAVLRPDLLSHRLTSVLNLTQDSSMYLSLSDLAGGCAYDQGFLVQRGGSRGCRLPVGLQQFLCGLRDEGLPYPQPVHRAAGGVRGVRNPDLPLAAGQLLSLRPEADCQAAPRGRPPGAGVCLAGRRGSHGGYGKLPVHGPHGGLLVQLQAGVPVLVPDLADRGVSPDSRRGTGGGGPW